jgi:5-methyltetrahydropteroyltriglutamate--homocysteine methyltransferase
VRLHLCRSNIAGRWLAEGGYDPIAKKLFNAFEVDRILMEYDSERSGSFAPLRFVPPWSYWAWSRRRSRALRARTTCFATHAQGNPLTMDDQRRKLELIAEIARKVWP